MARRMIVLTAFAGAMFAAILPAWPQQPSQSQVSAIRQSCRSDYQSYCSGVPTGGQAALSCLREHASSLSPACGQAVSAAGGSAAAPPAAPSQAGSNPASQPPASQPPAAQPPAGQPSFAPPPMGPRAEAALMRRQCGLDYRQFCQGVRVGGGRAIACLANHQEQLSPGCQTALMSMRPAR